MRILLDQGENEGGNEIQWWLKVFPVVSRELSVANHWHDRYAAISYETNHGSYHLRDYNEITLIVWHGPNNVAQEIEVGSQYII